MNKQDEIEIVEIDGKKYTKKNGRHLKHMCSECALWNHVFLCASSHCGPDYFKEIPA